MTVYLICPHCGGTMSADEAQRQFYCPYCGALLENRPQTADHMYDSGQPLPPGQQPMVYATRPVRSWQSILGFVLALTLIGCIPGAIFCIVDLCNKEDGRTHGLSVAGLIIAGVFIVGLIGQLFNGGNPLFPFHY